MMETNIEKIIGAFIFPDVWMTWDQKEAKNTYAALQEFGINTIFTEAEHYRRDLIDRAHDMDMRWFGSIACFSDHANDNQLVRERRQLWPVSEDGRRRPQMEWYIGVTPSFEEYNRLRLDLLQKLVRDYPLDGFFLDFIRWPIHWELELRPGAARPLDGSFDAHTLERFQRQTGLQIPARLTTTPEKANWIHEHHRQTWIDFKCSVVTGFVSEAVERIQATRGQDFRTGLFILPLPANELQAIAGQRLSELGSLVDFLAPMLYHAILLQPPAWVADTVKHFTQPAAGKLLPVVQVDSAEGTEAGADWGPPVPPDEWETVARTVLQTPGARGLIAFTGTSLFRDQRGEGLASVVKKSS